MRKAKAYVRRLNKENPELVYFNKRKKQWTAQWDDDVKDSLNSKERDHSRHGLGQRVGHGQSHAHGIGKSAMGFAMVMGSAMGLVGPWRQR